jgi:hypothetical protein
MDRLIREHRGSLIESMATVRPVRDREQLLEIIRESLSLFGVFIKPEQITVTPYVPDARVGWDTHLICIEGYGVWGMANGPI